MPELPEVERCRRLLEAVAAGRSIEQAECLPDPLVFSDEPHEAVAAALRGRRVEGAGRKGKYLWLALDGRPWPLFHLGMTGDFAVRGRRSPRLRSSAKRNDPGWPPRFTRLRLTLDDGTEVAFADARRLGRIRLRRDPEAEPPVARLGFDALTGLPPTRGFAAALGGRRTALKALLLDQAFAAGVGNWIADEVLYQARLDPRRPANTLSAVEAALLRAKLSLVVRTAVRLGSDGDRYPRHWLFHHRWGRRAGARTARGETIDYLTVGGRTTAYVPSVQAIRKETHP